MSGSHTCSTIVDILPEFLAGRLTPEEDARVRDHLEKCSDCENRAAAVSLLQQTPAPSPDPERWDHFVKGVVDETQRRRRRYPSRSVLAVAAMLLLLAGSYFVWDRLDRGLAPPTDELERLAREVAELPEEEVAAWTAGLGSAGWPAAGFDTTGLTEEELQQLVTEVDRT